MKTRRVFVTILMFIAIMVISIFTNEVQAESLGYLTITKDRKVENVTYQHQIGNGQVSGTKNIWKLIASDQNGTPSSNKIPDLYCLRAGLGFTSENLNNRAVQYNQSYEMMSQYESLVTYFKTLSSETKIFGEDEQSRKNFKAVMWILDNMLLEDATNAEVKAYLKEYAEYKDRNFSESDEQLNILTRADIEAIQQLAIWYFTNSDEAAYNNQTLPTIYMKIIGGEQEYVHEDYKTYGDLFNGKGPQANEQYGQQRQDAAAKLYENLITKAVSETESGEYVPSRKITVYLAGTNAATEQPVVRVEKKKEEVDIALRKFISEVNGVKLEGDNSREPQVDTSKLNTNVGNKLQTTAEYNHTKQPLKVSIGDIITYTLRIYNEGEVDAYVTEVTDYLPPYLEFYDDGEQTTWWTPDAEESGRKSISTEFCKVVGVGGEITEDKIGQPLKSVLLPKAKYNNTDKDYDLSYVDIQIKCKVMPTAHYFTNITNIAQITEMKDINNAEIENDRDSTPDGKFNLPSDDTLPNYKDNESSNSYVPGQEDDDDFEKVYVPTPEIDLALRKFISAVGDTKYERAPEVNTEELQKGADTAVYNHSKVPVQVEVGDVVTYTLRIYNEGDVNARVTQVKDYLAKHLKYVPFGDDKNGDWWTETAGTDYNTLTSTENCKITGVGGKTDTQYVGKNIGEAIIPAYDKENDELSYIDIEVHCQVLPVDTTTKITNIAEITKQADEYGTEIPEDRDSTPDDVEIPKDLPGYKDEDTNKPYVPGQEDDDDFEKVVVVVPELDLALRKFISAVDGVALQNTREPNVETGKLDQNVNTTAEYNHPKNPVSVKQGGLVTYTIRVYNEGEFSGYVSEITDYLPNYLIYLPDNETNKKYGWVYDELTREVKTTITSMENEAGEEVYKDRKDKKLLHAYKGDGTLDYIDVEIVCKVDEQAVGNGILTNLAQITKETDETGKNVEKDRDSTPNGNFREPSETEKPNYKDNESNKPYVPGQEDDDDFEKVLVIKPEYDLALRKFISAVDGVELENTREPNVKTDKLDSRQDTTSEYEHSKKPVQVKKGSLVTYTIRVYNEGELDAIASEITDYLPNYLIYLPDNEINKKYGWTYNEQTRQVKTTITSLDSEAGEEVYKDRENGKLLLAYDGNGELDYIDVQIVCKIDEKAIGNGILTNLAQITEQTDKNGNEVPDDRDSTPDGEFKEPTEEEKPKYKEDEENKPYVPGQEDDDDYEKVVVKPDFDLALRKFITQVGNLKINTRYPQVSYDEEKDKLTYKHSKDPVEVITGDIVTYTIRVYNEGEADGYANEITDDMPEGLEFLPDNEINKEYRWVMLDENQEETKDVSKAKYIVTDYLSEEQEEETGRSNLIKAYDKEKGVTEGNPDFKDVQVAFKVVYKATTTDDTKRTIVNTAQISDDSDDDDDSEPKRDEEYDPKNPDDNEDDIDYDQVKVKYFDLSLLKWVSETIVTLNGKTDVINTGHTAETSKNEDTVKLEIKSKDINKISIKYRYTIRVTNEGEIEGYATEVTDYIPEGLKFVKEDNPDWYEKENGVIATKALENKLLKPGESAEIQVVLTWINNKENFGKKVNLAEISEDDNPSDSPDVDSTPNNKKEGEDDIDDAPVIIAVKTGGARIYLGLVMIILVTFAGGISLIKKYVLE